MSHNAGQNFKHTAAASAPLNLPVDSVLFR